MNWSAVLVGGVVALGCCSLQAQQQTDKFSDTVSFVGQHSKLVVLTRPNGSSIAVWPAMQGRVLTSAVTPDGRSFGWVNQELIASGKVQPHINAVGGEDRLWLGPEGGQYSIFFAPGAKFDLDHWFTPAAVDTEPFDVVSQTANSIAMRKNLQVTNYSGTRFSVRIDREVDLLAEPAIWRHLGMAPIAGVTMVGYESKNKLTNLLSTPMSKSTGVLSLWVLGQFQAAAAATIILPIRPGSEEQLGPPAKTDYFGPVPADRIEVGKSAVFFKADAGYRSKLGVSPRRSRGTIGSYDPEHHVLTIVQYDGEPNADYVNSAWEIQKQPYKGDIANCYNDGPPAPGKPQLGHFYELESSSPAVALAPNASVSHVQRTIHLVGTEEQLNQVAKALLGVELKQVLAFNHP
jgi:hypothetical protein